ncbi:hypothetical protein P4629_23610 [Priestia aryabhattai]|uniref:hypothetical protein n=1 Tax=Priestia aryabhattai TaxID=412384 RepID=UPI002E1C2B47|nr:hypothetical protein [Priestia aryabhattai]
MRYMSWTAYDTAIDFRARLRFPRAAAEPPRRFRSCGVSPVPLFPQESSPCPPNQLLEATKQIKLYAPSQKNEPLIKQVDEWFVFYLGSTTFVPASFFIISINE